MEYYSVFPDEIVSEILSPALRVPEESFESTTYQSPFAKYELSTSTALLVCKSWLRVSTPLLYHTVILRSKAQAQALERALRSNKLLGTFIKKMRIEGGYGSPMHTILKSSPNLSDLWMTLVLYSTDSIAGLVKGFPLINPTRVIVQDQPYATGCAIVKQFTDVLCEAIKTWDKMVSFSLGYPPNCYQRFYGNIRAEKLAEALIKFSKVEILHLQESWNFPAYLHGLVDMPSLKEIRIKSKGPGNLTDISRQTEFHRRILQNAKLRAKVVFTIRDETSTEINDSMSEVSDDREMIIALPANPDFIPLSSVSSRTRNAIWGEILWHVMNLPDDFERDPDLNENWNCSEQASRSQLLLVSKTFYRIARPFLYQIICVHGNHALKLLAQTLSRNPELGPRIRALGANAYQGHTDLRYILRCASNLVVVTTCHSGTHLPSQESMDWRTFVALSETAGRSLRHLHQSVLRATSSKPVAPDVLYTFSRLQSLVWHSQTKFVFEQNKIPWDAFPALEHLTYSSSNGSFLTLLSFMELPFIRTVEMPVPEKMEGAKAFIEAHGHKITSMKTRFFHDLELFNLCPNLEELILPNSKYGRIDLNNFECTSAHLALRKVVITFDSLRRSQIKGCFKWLGEVDLSKFKAMRELQIYLCTWPTDEQGIRKSFWVQWSERLLQWNISISDRNGKTWTPRLKPIKR